MLLNNPVIRNLIEKLWDQFWSGGISNPLTAIEQITYLLFMKKLDDNESIAEKNVNEGYWKKEETKFRFKGKFDIPGIDEKIDKNKLRWSYFKKMKAEEMLQHVQTKVFPYIKQLNGETSSFTRHMVNAVFIIPKPSLLVEATKTIDLIFEEMNKEEIPGGHTFQDIQGDVYEMLLSEIATAGKNGQFRTPRHIIKLMTDLVDPQLGNKIADPACGTGGFLLGAYQYIVTQLNSNKSKIKPDEDGFIRSSISSGLNNKTKKILGESLYGFDIDTTMVRLGTMNLIMHGIEDPKIDYKDTLSKSYFEEDKYNIVMANPPFTGSIDKGDINENLKISTTKTELLFVERIFRMLKVGGTAAVIVPQGVLFGAGKAFKRLRQLIIDNTELKAVIACPNGVFKPYAGVSTAILIFTKGGQTENVWFYNMENDGYSLDDKRTKLDGYGDLQDIIKKYKKRYSQKGIGRKGKCFLVSKKEIADEEYDLTISKYKEEEYQEIQYDHPSIILEKLIGNNGLENKIIEQLKELKDLLK